MSKQKVTTENIDSQHDGSSVEQERIRIGERIDSVVEGAGETVHDVVKIGSTALANIAGIGGTVVGGFRRALGKGWESYSKQADKSSSKNQAT